jgi:hypothetical protein
MSVACAASAPARRRTVPLRFTLRRIRGTRLRVPQRDSLTHMDGDAHTAACPGRAAAHRVAALTRDPFFMHFILDPGAAARRCVWAPERRRTVPQRFTLRRIRGTQRRMARRAAPHPGHAAESVTTPVAAL